ncbi:MAG: alpha/beta fold hydrolase [Sandaracinaceae bacterium]|nr:alpha/beta fold hydrolase [Sandaracinaceae bacterium]
MEILWIAIGAAVTMALALVLHYVYWVKRYTVSLPYELEERVPTRDGSAIELRRIPAVEDAPRAGPPVLLVHGLALNHRNNDLLEDLSLARYLAKHGRDVWLLTLRSGRADLRWRERSLVSYERMAEHDLPAAIDHVLARTGASSLDYVGFSMGGMLIYAALGRFVGPGQIRKVVILGSPARLRPPLKSLMLARYLPPKLTPGVPLRLLSRMGSFAAELVITPWHRIVYNPDNVERGVAAMSLVNGFVDIPGTLNSEFAHWVAISGEVLYRAEPVVVGLRKVGVPVLFIAGKEDRLATPDAVRHAYEAWGADHEGVDKRLVVLGIEEGAAGDYGHGDLAIGRFAAEDVFDPVTRFLAES